MKTTILFILTSLVYAFIITDLPSALSSQHAKQVKDTNGNPILPGSRYLILPAFRSADGGGISLGRTTANSECPVTIQQDYFEVVTGLPVKFSIAGVDISTGAILTGTPLDIEFAEKPECATSSKWHFVGDDFPREWVGIGGVHHENRSVLNGSFKIEKYCFVYKLVFCPIFTSPLGLCFDIGRQDDDNNGRRLILTEEGDPAFRVVFVHADVDDAANRISSIL